MFKVPPHAVPPHIAIIPDGNGRWAKERGLSRLEGHIRGTANVKDLVIYAKELGVKVLTIYAFSEENWLRPGDEVSGLMDLLKDYLKRERKNLCDNNIQLMAMGDIDRLPEAVKEELTQTLEETKANHEMILNFAISYGGRQEILEAVKIISELYKENKISLSDIDQRLFSICLKTKDLPDPDLLIRTSGEMRISNFLLWQIAYTELYVTDTYWPDFDRQAFLKALESYGHRERRYGMISEQVRGQDVLTL